MDATTIVNMDAVDALMEVVTKATELFTVYPINVYLIGGLVALGLGLFAKAKHII